MVVEAIGMNFSVFQNWTLTTGLENMTSTEFFSAVPVQANALGQGYLGYIILGVLSIILFVMLADKSVNGDFQYDDSRAITISAGICSMISLKMVVLGFLYNYTTVGFFAIIFVLGNILILISENKE